MFNKLLDLFNIFKKKEEPAQEMEVTDKQPEQQPQPPQYNDDIDLDIASRAMKIKSHIKTPEDNLKVIPPAEDKHCIICDKNNVQLVVCEVCGNYACGDCYVVDMTTEKVMCDDCYDSALPTSSWLLR